jgi:competence protein ComFC
MYTLNGNWAQGFAYDLHTLRSEYLGQNEHGHNAFNTTRTEMGELVYKLKYCDDISVIGKIVNLINKSEEFSDINIIIPIPPSNKSRQIQPVQAIANALGESNNISVSVDILHKKNGCKEIKSISAPLERQASLKESMSINRNQNIKGKVVLLIDDLYCSGTTLSYATELLIKAGAKKVNVLTMTKTRSKR